MSIEDIKARILKLSRMTVENGCSEQEALSAAQKMAKLLDENGLAMSDLKAYENKTSKPDLEQGVYEDGRKNRHEINFCINAIAKFFDCVAYSSKNPFTKETSYKFFGFAADVAAAIELTKAIAQAMESDYDRWYVANKSQYPHDHGRTLRKSFMIGFAQRIIERLKEFKSNRNVSTGTALIVLKNQIVTQAFEEANSNVTFKKSTTKYNPNGAHAAGYEAGGRANITNKHQIEA